MVTCDIKTWMPIIALSLDLFWQTKYDKDAILVVFPQFQIGEAKPRLKKKYFWTFKPEKK